MYKKIIMCIVVIIFMQFAACNSNESIRMINRNSESNGSENNLVEPDRNDIRKTTDSYKLEFGNSIVEYKYLDAKIILMDEIDSWGYDEADFAFLPEIDKSKYDEIKLLLVSFKAKALQSPGNDDLIGINEHISSGLRLYSENAVQTEQYQEPALFALANETSDIYQLTQESQYYHFKLPENEVVDVIFGFYIDYNVQLEELMLLAGYNPENYQYILMD